jgi:cysteine sulfinate desulfinase/cysteine desulfurase-like protein
VLLALGLDEDTTHYAIRIGMGRFNTIDEIKTAKDAICSSVKSIKEIKI